MSDNSASVASESERGEPKLGLIAQIGEDLKAHRGDWTLPGFRAVAVCRFGQWRMSKPKLLRIPLSIIYRILFRRCRNVYGIELPYSITIGRRTVVEHQGAIVVHGNSVIGDDCYIRQGVTLGNRYIERPYDAPVLGNRVNVGAGAKILGKVQIGDDAVIGANSVVLKDVAAGETVVGIPARPIKKKSECDNATKTADAATTESEVRI